MSTCTALKDAFVASAVFIGVITCFFLAIAHLGIQEKRQSCDIYSTATGRETKLMGDACYVRSGDHFVPREEYRQ